MLAIKRRKNNELEVVPEHAYWQHKALIVWINIGTALALASVAFAGSRISSGLGPAQFSFLVGILVSYVAMMFQFRNNPTSYIARFNPSTQRVWIKRRARLISRRHRFEYANITAVNAHLHRPKVGKPSVNIILHTIQGKRIPCTWRRPVTEESSLVARCVATLIRAELALSSDQPDDQVTAELVESVRSAPATSVAAELLLQHAHIDTFAAIKIATLLRSDPVHPPEYPEPQPTPAEAP